MHAAGCSGEDRRKWSPCAGQEDALLISNQVLPASRNIRKMFLLFK